MIDFAKYAFNKSHAAAYAVVSYQTAYLKYYYPKEFMAALMSSVMENVSKFSEYILNCRRMMNIAVLPPDINEGESGFSVSGGGIRYGLSAIKSVGKPVVDAILEERAKNGKFRTMEDFINRMTQREVTAVRWKILSNQAHWILFPAQDGRRWLWGLRFLRIRQRAEECL